MSTPGDATDAKPAKRDALAEEARRLREQAAAEKAAGNDWRAARLLDRALAIYRDSGDLRGVTQVMGELAPVGGVKGTSWPVALGFLVVLLAVAAGVIFLGIRLGGG
ncbi:MAG TPA: hypothetical protein VG709_04240, partial [Actinomycetota bacterium]|nr:hypothetical protein [Actinomycetota bacterium]